MSETALCVEPGEELNLSRTFDPFNDADDLGSTNNHAGDVIMLGGSTDEFVLTDVLFTVASFHRLPS
jgi:hypothetical protein